MPYWRLFYHVVWATKDRQPLIQDSFAQRLHQQIGRKATELGAIVHAVGGVQDHVHLVVSVPPTVALSEFIGQVKGNSSHFVNHEVAVSEKFAWQADYGIISLDSKQIDRIVEYVKGQPEHHRSHTSIPVLERAAGDAQVGGKN